MQKTKQPTNRITSNLQIQNRFKLITQRLLQKNKQNNKQRRINITTI